MKRTRRWIAVLSMLVIVGVQQNPAAAAPQTQVPAYEASEEPTFVRNDVTGLATATAAASADRLTGNLSGSADAEGIAPTGAFAQVYTNFGRAEVYVGIAAGYARPKVIHGFPVTGGGALSVQAQVTSISGQTASNPPPEYDPATGTHCTNCTSQATATAYLEANAYYYPCAPITANCHWSREGGSGYTYLASITGGIATINFDLLGTTSGPGTLIVEISAVAGAFVSGHGSATARITGTVSSITVGP